MKSTAVKTFLLGVACGAGATVLSLYTQKPACLAAYIEALVEMGRARRVKEVEKETRKERLKAMGFSDEEIGEIYP